MEDAGTGLIFLPATRLSASCSRKPGAWIRSPGTRHRRRQGASAGLRGPRSHVTPCLRASMRQVHTAKTPPRAHHAAPQPAFWRNYEKRRLESAATSPRRFACTACRRPSQRPSPSPGSDWRRAGLRDLPRGMLPSALDLPVVRTSTTMTAHETVPPHDRGLVASAMRMERGCPATAVVASSQVDGPLSLAKGPGSAAQELPDQRVWRSLIID